jgi:glycosyltransferase involved in cell wall biosynthesis
MVAEKQSRARVAFILPPREIFAPDSAGAIAMVVQRLAAATPGAVVMGRIVGRNSASPSATFPNIPYHGANHAFALIRTLRALNPEFIDVHQQPRLAILLSYALPNAKIMLFLHNDPLTMRGLKTRFARRFALARLHRVVCVSDYLRARYMTGLPAWGLPPEGVAGTAPALLPNPLTLSELPPRATVRAPEILFAGRIVADKGPDVFILACAYALKKLPGWTATMMGGDRFGPRSPETPYVRNMRNAASHHGIGFTGPRPHAEILAAMAQAAIVVVPSRWPEPFGLVALEAAASGATIIASEIGGLPEAAGNGALYIAPDDAAELAAAILTVASRADRRAVLGAANLEWAQRFDTPLIAAALENLRATV